MFHPLQGMSLAAAFFGSLNVTALFGSFPKIVGQYGRRSSGQPRHAVAECNLSRSSPAYAHVFSCETKKRDMAFWSMTF